ncbi:Flp family type IVb pilin [Aquidulcibacter paucihalophilus]|uniref:Flp family type IVb pilin n=1 Tax=Aquidulcibacter paucihalophilus TaxID=1978549 RepID=UPI000A18F482|nr:Flp family type IVb pilin [Aquidulcibacter paucihalophilus]
MILKKLKNQRGATAIEYGLIAALMMIVMIPAMQMVGGNTNGMYDRITNKIVEAMATAR